MSNNDLAIEESQTIARPANTTAYASGDLVANSTTAGSVEPFSVAVARSKNMRGKITRVRIIKSDPSITNAAFRVHFFRVLPVVTNGDNGVFAPTALASYGYLGAFDVTVDLAGGTSGAVGVGVAKTGAGTEMIFKPVAGSRNLYALIEARGAYTPASAETFKIEVEIERD